MVTRRQPLPIAEWAEAALEHVPFAVGTVAVTGDVSPKVYLAIGVAAFAIGVLFLVLWTRPMLRSGKRHATFSA